MTKAIQACKGCGQEHSGKFCSDCGQKVIEGRFTFRQIFQNLLTTILNVDYGIIYTFKELTLRPGKIVREYLDGKTKAYFNPFSFLFLAITLNVLITVSTGLYDIQIDNMLAESYEGKDQEYIDSQLKTQEILKQFMNFLILVTLPGLAVVSYWVTRKKEYLLAEHFVANCYFYGYTIFLALLLVPLQLYFSDTISLGLMMAAVISFTYYAWAYKNWLGYSIFGAIYRSILVNTLGTMLAFSIYIIVGIIIAMVAR